MTTVSTVPIVPVAATSYIPVYQLSNSVSQTNGNQLNGNDDQHQPLSTINPHLFQFRNQQTTTTTTTILKTNENLTTTNDEQLHHTMAPIEPAKELTLNRLKISSPNPIQINSTSASPIPNPSPSATVTQFTYANVTNLSRTPSIRSDRDRSGECPLPMQPTQFSIPRTIASPSLTQMRTERAYPLAKSPIPLPRNDEFVPVNQINPEYQMQSELPIHATIDEQKFQQQQQQLQQQQLQYHQRLLTEQQRQSISPQMMNFQQIEERMVDQLNELYKATMMMHNPQQQQCPDEVDLVQPQYMQREMIYNNPGSCFFGI